MWQARRQHPHEPVGLGRAAHRGRPRGLGRRPVCSRSPATLEERPRFVATTGDRPRQHALGRSTTPSSTRASRASASTPTASRSRGPETGPTPEFKDKGFLVQASYALKAPGDRRRVVLGAGRSATPRSIPSDLVRRQRPRRRSAARSATTTTAHPQGPGRLPPAQERGRELRRGHARPTSSASRRSSSSRAGARRAPRRDRARCRRPGRASAGSVNTELTRV